MVMRKHSVVVKLKEILAELSVTESELTGLDSLEKGLFVPHN